MEGDKIKTNILIAGKSGVGKSSLLNYIFGEEVAETCLLYTSPSPRDA